MTIPLRGLRNRKANAADRITEILCIILVLTGSFLAIYGINRPIYGDENCTWDRVSPSISRSFINNYGQEWLAMPLYPTTLSIITRITGRHEAAFRIMSLVGGMLGIGCAFLLGCHAFGRRTGFIAAALLAITPFFVEFSSYARPYVPGTAAFSMLILMIIRYQGRGNRFQGLPRNYSTAPLWSAAILLSGLLWSHYIHFAALASLLFLAVFSFKQGANMDFYKKLALVAAVAILPLIVPTIRCFVHLQNEWLPYAPVSFYSLALGVLDAFLVSSPSFPLNLLSLLTITAAVSWAVFQTWRHPDISRAGIIAALIPAIVSLTVSLAFHLMWGARFHHARFLALSGPAAAVCLGAMISRILPSKMQIIALALLALFLLPHSADRVISPADNWFSRAEFADQITSYASNTDTQVFFLYNQAELYWRFYQPPGLDSRVLVPFRGEELDDEMVEEYISAGKKLIAQSGDHEFVLLVDYNPALPFKPEWRHPGHERIRQGLVDKISKNWPGKLVFLPGGDSVEKMFVLFQGGATPDFVEQYPQLSRGAGEAAGQLKRTLSGVSLYAGYFFMGIMAVMTAIRFRRLTNSPAASSAGHPGGN